MDCSSEISFDDILSTTSNKRLSRVIKIEIDENDDTQEKQAKIRRKSAMLELGLTGNTKNRPVDNLTSTLTSEQITNHYGDCMKLSSENKITSRNAFDLHLIDYLQDHLKRLQNFQVLSSSLDAGAKIYAGRVDLVHSSTYHIITGCAGGHGDDGNGDDHADSAPEDKDDMTDIPTTTTTDIKPRRPKKRNDVARKMTCTNMRKIRLTAAQIRSEVDPLFASKSNKFDEGSTGELRLNNLKLLDEKYELLLDFESLVSTRSRDDDTVDMSHTTVFDIGEFEPMLNDLSRNHVIMCSDFVGFKFTGWDSLTDTTDRDGTYALSTMSVKDETLADLNDYYDNNNDNNNNNAMGDDYADDDYEPMIKPDDNEGVISESKGQENEMDDNMLTIGSSKYEQGSSVFVSSIKEMVNKHMDNYGELNDNILGMWAGPDHWKQKAKSVKIVTSLGDNITKPTKTPKTKKEVVPMFAERVEARVNSDGIGRLVDIKRDEKNEIKSSKVVTQLTDDCLSKNLKKEYLLPARSLIVFKPINQLMNRDISLVNKVLKQQTQQLHCVDLDGDQLPNADAHNNNEVFEMGYDEMIVINDDGNISHHNDDGADDDAYYSDDDPYTGVKSFRNCDFNDFRGDDHEADYPRRVETMDINYAKTAKQINVKKLKHEILLYLTKEIHVCDLTNPNNKSKDHNIKKSSEQCHLSDLISSVDKKVSSGVSKELSVSILMTCLLHLANEAGLDIESAADFSDFSLGQGYSQYDLEQIALFGDNKAVLSGLKDDDNDYEST